MSKKLAPKPAIANDGASAMGDVERNAGKPAGVILSPGAQVIAWMVDGQREADIAAAVLKAFPGQDPNKLLKAAVDHFVDASHSSQNVIVGWALEAYRELYRRTIDIGDFTAAAKIVKEMTALAKMLPSDDE